MNKYILAGFVLFLSTFLLSQDLNEKKKHLEDLKDEISKQEELIRKTERKKQETENDLKSKQKKKIAADSKIKKLFLSEVTAKEKLNETISKLKVATTKLEKLNLLCELEFSKLFISHYTSVLNSDNKINCQILASLIKDTVEEINLSSDQKTSLENAKEKDSKQYEDFVWSRIVTSEKSAKYSNEISELGVDISELEKEKRNANAIKVQLEEEAAALDELITKLQSDITTEIFSFKFSTPKLIWPVKGKIIRGFGEQRSDKYKVTVMNDGIDIGVKVGSSVVAVDEGIVAFAEWYGGAGKLVIINHKNGYYSLYSHNSVLMVSKGDKVKKNQQIALSGKTGSTDKECLHFEIRKRGTPVNPLDFLE
jgi:murein DD-endopeptidase MepM/ murein hydrolase activator NlpD